MSASTHQEEMFARACSWMQAVRVGLALRQSLFPTRCELSGEHPALASNDAGHGQWEVHRGGPSIEIRFANLSRTLSRVVSFAVLVQTELHGGVAVLIHKTLLANQVGIRCAALVLDFSPRQGQLARNGVAMHSALMDPTIASMLTAGDWNFRTECEPTCNIDVPLRRVTLTCIIWHPAVRWQWCG